MEVRYGSRRTIERRTVLRVGDVADRLGVSRSTLRRLRQSGSFPPARRLSARAVGWLVADVDRWLQSAPRQR